MNNLSQKRILFSREVQILLQPPPIPLNKSKIGSDLKNDYDKTKLCRNYMLEPSNMYEFKNLPFENGDMEKFLLFKRILGVQKLNIYIC